MNFVFMPPSCLPPVFFAVFGAQVFTSIVIMRLNLNKIILLTITIMHQKPIWCITLTAPGRHEGRPPSPIVIIEKTWPIRNIKYAR